MTRPPANLPAVAPAPADAPPAGRLDLAVVIPTLGRPLLLRTLQSLLAAEGAADLEIVVAGRLPEGETLAGLRSLQRAHPRLQHLPVAFERGDSSRKKNAGFRASRAPVVAFIDDDVAVAPDWPRRIVEPFADPAVGLVSGPALVPDDLPLAARLAGVALASPAAGYAAERYLADGAAPRPVKWSRLIGCNMAYRRGVLEEIGLFDPAFWPGEEMLAAFQATARGHRLVFHPAARLYHYPRTTLSRFCRQIYGYGATRVRLLRAGVEFEPATLLPALWWTAWLGLVALGLFFRAAALAAAATLAAYLLWCLAIALRKAAQTGQPRDALMFLLIPVMHLSYGIGQWVEFCRPGRDFSEAGGGGPPRAEKPSDAV